MGLSDAELVSFCMRTARASQQGYSVARADQYMEMLEAEVGTVDLPDGVEEGSAAHLHVMASAAMKARASGSKKPVAKKVTVTEKVVMTKAPKVEAKVVEAPPAPTSELEVEEVPAPEPAKEEVVVPASYDTWSYDQLYAEAQERGIPNRSKMSKVELIAVLEANDAENAK